MRIRCTLDGLVLRAELSASRDELIVFDGEESFVMDAVEALYYHLVAATADEVRRLAQSRYRLLRRAADFELVND